MKPFQIQKLRSRLLSPAQMPLEGLQKFDQGAFILVAESWLLFKVAGSEIMATIDHKVWTLVEFQQGVDHICPDFSGFFIARAFRKCLQVMLDLKQQC